MLIEGLEKKPYVVALYGAAGIGKSTLANGANRAVFLDVEDALHRIGCKRSPVLKTSSELKAFINKLSTEYGSEFDTLVLDTIDALEDILIKEICLEHGKSSIASFGFGQGYDLLSKKWVELLSGFQAMSRQFKKNVILVGHDQIKFYADPNSDGYDRITLKMDKKSSLALVSKVDAVFYMCLDKQIRTTESGARKAVGTGRRVIYTEDSASCVAKNRYGLPAKLDATPDFFKDLEKLTEVVS